MSSRVIVHVDCDAFFASVEQRDNPALEGKPVIIGADPKAGQGRGVVSTCSYEARRYGIHSAMPISLAYQKCPQGIFLRGDHAKYSRIADEIIDVFAHFTPHVEPVSIDEAFLDMTGSFRLFGNNPLEMGARLKRDIFEKVRLTVSVGIAPCKMIAKIASDHCKPDGLLEIKQANALAFLWALPVEKLWGVGPKTRESLRHLGVATIEDLARLPLARLEEHFGENGRHLHQLANGIDPRPVKDGDPAAKSVSHEHTFDEDTKCLDDVENILLRLSEKVSDRLRQDGLKGKTLTLKIRTQGFRTHTRARKLDAATNHAPVIYQNARELLRRFYKPSMLVRLVGVRLSHFDERYVQESLFPDSRAIKREKVHEALDRIKDKFGRHAIHLAGKR